MDKLSVLAEFEIIADREELDNDEFRLFLLLLANYDNWRGWGEIRRRAVKAAVGNDLSSAKFKRACLRLSVLGLIEIVSHQWSRNDEDDAILVYKMTCVTQLRR